MISNGTDSQPSQILREALKDLMEISQRSNPEDQNSWIDDDSTDSGPRVAPHYHFHDLTSTQSQSPFQKRRGEQSSQNLNKSATTDNRHHFVAQEFPFASSSNTSSMHLSSARVTYVPEAPPTPCIPKTTKAAILASSALATSPQPALPPSRILSPPSPGSQDSFAGPPVRKDPELEFLAASKLFGMPLSELGTSQDKIFANPSTVKSQSSDESHSQDDAGPSFHTSQSQNPDSQSAQYGQNYEDYIVNNHNREAFFERDSQFGIDYQDSPSSSSEGLYNEVPTQRVEQLTQVIYNSSDVEEPTQIIKEGVQPFQVAEDEPTQSATSPVSASIDPPAGIPATGTTSNTSTNPRSLHSLVNKKWRLHAIPQLADSHPVSPSIQMNTQPTGPLNTPLNIPQTIPEQTITPVVPISPPIAVNRPKQDDGLDIVPDSEPPRSGSPSSKRCSSPGQQQNIPAAMKHVDEIVPDPVDDEAQPQLPPRAAASSSPLSDDDDGDSSIVAHTARSGRRLSLRVKNRAVYTEASGSESDIPLAKQNSKKFTEPFLPPPSKKRKLNAPKTPLARVTRSHMARSSRPNLKNQVFKGKGKGKAKLTDIASEATSSRKQTPASTEDDIKTELALDEDYMDENFKLETVRKRKRAVSTAKMSSANLKSAADITTPLTRSAKGSRSTASSLNNKGPGPTRVFARWTFSNYYYSGIVYSRSSRGNFVINFDDDTECDVEISHLRRCEFSVEDNVFLYDENLEGKVVSVDKWEQEGLVLVRMKNGADVEVPASAVRLSTNMISEQWARRTVQANSVVPFLQAQSLRASPSKSSFAGGTSSPKFLKHFGFVVTLGLGNANWENDRNKLMKVIEGKGGAVISDWSSIFELNADCRGKRWTANQSQLTYNEPGNENIRSVFLLADEPNMKPKFLIALALGIPCVSITWLNHCIYNDTLLDWTMYLLPAGQCPTLNVISSQRINLEWADKAHRMKDILTNPLASKLFQGKSVICVGDWMFPSGKHTKRNNSASELDEKQKEAMRVVPRIVLSMGADQVEAVMDPRHASQDLSQYNYVLFKEPEDVLRNKRNGVTCIHLPWMKECLIASRLLPLP